MNPEDATTPEELINILASKYSGFSPVIKAGALIFEFSEGDLEVSANDQGGLVLQFYERTQVADFTVE